MGFLQFTQMLLREWCEVVGDDVDVFSPAFVEDADKAVNHSLTIYLDKWLWQFYSFLCKA